MGGCAAAADTAVDCDEFLSKSVCVVRYDMSELKAKRVPTHSDVQTKVRGDAMVFLEKASPFLNCTVQATPAVPARDLSASVTAALTTAGALGAIAENVAEAVPGNVDELKKQFQSTIKAWSYTFESDSAAQAVVIKLYMRLYELLNYESTIEANVQNSGDNGYVIRNKLDDLRKLRDTIRQYSDVIDGFVTIVNKTPTTTVSSTIKLPLDRFRQKSVGETITCKDAATGLQPFSTMTFTAYYENTPVFDISAGAIMSLTPGRQVGVVSSSFASGAPAATGSGSCALSSTPGTCLGVTSQSKVQFMPAAFIEWHKNWKWGAVHNGEAYHPFGYVGTFGPAFGISANPNNGTANAEFFEGVSLGIQRLAIMVGFHNGRYQTFADGYYAGEEVPMGTTPRTERIWTTHLAFAITYRIALH
jgi:hypothetical protein